MTVRKMSVADWIKVEDNPIQRDTERHAAKAKHLLTPLPSHAFVFACELPNGKLIKLDGHTRALLWQRGQVPSPGFVEVAIIPAKDKAHAEALYKTFDSSNALETMRDKVSGAFNRFGFEPQSGLLVCGSITTALRMAYSVFLGQTTSTGTGSGTGNSSTPPKSRKVDVYTMVDEFSPELLALDGLKFANAQLPAGGVAAFLLSFRKYGHRVTPFWTSLKAKSGMKVGREMDGVQACLELLIAARAGKRYGGAAQYDICNRILTGVDKWLKDEVLISIPRPMDTLGYLASAPKPLERLIKKADIEKRAHAH